MTVQIRHIEQNDIHAVSTLNYREVHHIFGADYDAKTLALLNEHYYVRNWENRLESVQNPIYVVVGNGQVCGFVLFGPYRDKDSQPEEGEIYGLYIDSTANDADLLRLTLLETALSHLSFMGYSRFYAWIPEKDTILTNLLTGYQFEQDGRTRIDKQDGLVMTSKHFVKTLYHYSDDDAILRL